MHRGMLPGYIFFSFSLAFFAFGPFSKCTEACGLVIHFFVFMSVFFVGFKLCLEFCPFAKCTVARGPVIHFCHFYECFWHFAPF